MRKSNFLSYKKQIPSIDPENQMKVSERRENVSFFISKIGDLGETEQDRPQCKDLSTKMRAV